MNQHFSDTRKIDPTRADRVRPDGTPDNDDRAEIGPTPLAFAEWAAAGITPPNLARMREDRHARLVNGINDRGYGGALFFDPLNIRFATDATNMQLWNAHNPFRACFVAADGHMVLFEYKGSYRFLSGFNPLVSEVRGGAAMFYFSNGDRLEQDAHNFAGELGDLMAEHAPNKRIAVDKIMVPGYRALTEAGFTVEEGEELAEKVRSIKGPEEIAAMRCCMHACELSVAAMEQAARDNAGGGMTEDDVWAVLHAENIKRGGEWIETRLLSSGPRTNPWFQECGPRVLKNNEILGLDTDLVGCYGMCSDISRTWWIGDEEAPVEMRRQYQIGVEHIQTNAELLKPGVSFRELTFGGHLLAPEFVESRYGCKMHGVGLCDEWPLITYPEDWREGAFDYVVQPGMMFCVEVVVAHLGGDFSIKLEDQILITEDGHENLTNYPFDPRLMA